MKVWRIKIKDVWSDWIAMKVPEKEFLESHTMTLGHTIQIATINNIKEIKATNLSLIHTKGDDYKYG